MSTRLPVVVVVGSPNAGKSTLVNRLSGSRTTVVHETPGVTRDRKDVEVEWRGRHVCLVDTGGYDTTPDAPFAAPVREQVLAALASADLVLFVVDGRAGPVADDHEIADALRRARVTVLLLANKLDDPTALPAPELHQMGLGEPIAISALHGLGVGDLLDTVVDAVAGGGAAAEPGADGHEEPVRRRRGRRATGKVTPVAAGGGGRHPVPVAIVGRPNAGKSSLFNAVVGEPRVIVSEVAGTTRDAIDTVVTTRHGEFRFIDTAGMRKAAKVSGVEYYAYLRSLQSLERAHVAVVVLDATLGIGELDVQIAVEAARHHCATVLAVNKSDLAEVDLEEVRGVAGRKLRQRPAVVAVSALTHAGVAALLAMVALLDTRYTAHIATAELNRALSALTAERPLPAKAGRRLKMYYAAQFGTAPPRIAIEVNDRALVTRDYGYFVENRLRGRFDLQGVPLVIDFKGR
jgi:GTPase